MMYRSAALLKLAKDMPCMLAIPGICNGRNVVMCHSNWMEHGKGVGLKSHDCFVSAGCEACHSAVDNRLQRLEPDDRKYYWQRGFERTLLWLFTSGHVCVKSKP